MSMYSAAKTDAFSSFMAKILSARKEFFFSRSIQSRSARKNSIPNKAAIFNNLRPSIEHQKKKNKRKKICTLKIIGSCVE